MIQSKPKAAADVTLPQEGYAELFIGENGEVAVKKDDGTVTQSAVSGSSSAGDFIEIGSNVYSIIKKVAWANKPDPGPASGTQIFVTDIGLYGSYWVSDGLRWNPTSEITLFKALNTTVSGEVNVLRKTDSDTTESVLAQYLLPGGVMTDSSTLRIEPVWTFSSGSSTKTLRVRFGSSFGMNKVRGGSGAETQTLFAPLIDIINRRSYNTQIIPYIETSLYTNASTGNIGTSNVNTVNDVNIQVSGQWGTAGDGSKEITLRSVIIRLIP